MSRTESLGAYLRAQGRRRLDRVEVSDDGRNARCALALLDAAAYAESLPEDDPIVEMLEQAGCFGPLGFDEFSPGEEAARFIREWVGSEPHELLLALPAVAASA